MALLVRVTSRVVKWPSSNGLSAQGFKNIVSGVQTRWEELLVMEQVVDKEASIAQQEGWFHLGANIQPTYNELTGYPEI